MPHGYIKLNRALGALGWTAAIGAAGYAAGRAVFAASRYMDLADKSVLITGGSRGLGLLLAREFGRRGSRVAICARDEGELQRVRDEFAAKDRKVRAVCCDVSDRDQARRMLETLETEMGGLSVLVNCAGTVTAGPLENQTIEEFEEAMRVNFWGAVNTCLAAIPGMQARRSGRIVNIGSIGGKVAVPHLLPYTASKFALVGFSEGLRAELAKDRVWVTTVCPGIMRTGSARNAWFRGQHRSEYSWFTMGAALPGPSISAERAARRVVRACQFGESEVILGPAAKLAILAHALAPRAALEAAAAANFWLPKPVPGAGERRKGHESETPLTRSAVTKLMRIAEIANNQVH